MGKQQRTSPREVDEVSIRNILIHNVSEKDFRKETNKFKETMEQKPIKHRRI